MSVSTPFGFFLARGNKGQVFIAQGMRDANAVTSAIRAGRSITTERAVLVRGSADNPTAESVTIITLQDERKA